MNLKRYISAKTISRIVLFTGMLLMVSCDSGFEEMNRDPNAYTEPDIGSLFTTSLIRTVGTGTEDRNRTNIKYLSGAMQYHATLQTFWYGEKGIVNQQTGNFFETAYTSHMRELSVILEATEDNPELVNQNAIAKIWKVYVLHRVTDAYGDVPYTEAVKGSSELMFKPVYDRQSEIYPMMLAELEEAIGQFDASRASFGGGDVVYGGRTDRWKTFAYSLMLRLGMRLTKVDAAMAREWVVKAYNGGVMQSNDDIAVLEHAPTSGNTWNWDARELKRESLPESNQGLGLVKMGKTFVDLLQEHDDPRIPFYMTLWEGNINARQSQVLSETTEPSLQKGLPNGYDPGTISEIIPGWNNGMLAEFSEPNTATIANFSTPSIILSYSECEFLLAEAALRGWISDTPQDHYHNAIRGNMESAIRYPNSSVDGVSITSDEIDDYIANHPLTGSNEEQMRQIHTQFYLAHYMYLDFFEAWSNWKRTGFPEMAPITYPLNTTGGRPIRRLMYSYEERALNTMNVEAAISAQGPDNYLTRVWWDAE
ncbi:SusD/RagB family nutrient-binding outer membrane lipoprotein [Sinomicrobium oceani]|uniref:SusD/RagB family nutrient-binding outer membrane lipoprotein n=1 Tax=Sinomicrobium oceani TaxID=1150368 RepID=UPI00227B07A3|nr:SusD/RagB family nutrient-binding outer membrane lipoprotein [Sinomicrobium oceani]